MASSGKVVLATGNWFGAVSTDGGDNFRYINPTRIFPNRDDDGNLLEGGFCCDQVVQYVPSIDRFVWLMLFFPSDCLPVPKSCRLSGVNRLRIAVASPEDVARTGLGRGGIGSGAWTYWDLTSAALELGDNWMDYPALAVGDNYLYLSTNVVIPRRETGTLVVRIPLKELRDGVTSIWRVYPRDDNRSVSVTHNTGSTAFWASHNSTSQMRVFSWDESDTDPSVRDVNIASWPAVGLSSIAPDGTDWLKILALINPGSNIIGATRRFNELWFAWTAGGDHPTTLPPPNHIPHPRIELVILDATTFEVIHQDRIWSPDYAYAYPALATNSSGDVAISFGWGGELFYPNHGVGILTIGLTAVKAAAISDAAFDRWGDYVTVRQHYPDTRFFSAGGYALRTVPGTSEIRAIPHYILFGRSSDIGLPGPGIPP